MKQEYAQSLTFSKPVGCGHIYVIIDEKDDVFDRLWIKGDMAKSCDCGEAWLNSLASLLTFALRRSLWEGTTQRGIVKHLLYQKCPKALPNKEHITSCADAIGRCVLEYLKRCDLENTNEVENELR